MGKLIARTKIKREANKLYYCKTDENGYLGLYEAELKRGRRKKDNQLNNNKQEVK